MDTLLRNIPDAPSKVQGLNNRTYKLEYLLDLALLNQMLAFQANWPMKLLLLLLPPFASILEV